MTMFKKVFGSQMAASDTPHDAEEVVFRSPRSQPILAPHPQVMTTLEEENAARRAQKAADLASIQQRQVKTTPVDDPVSLPQAAPLAQTADIPPPAAAPVMRPAGRARTRLLGFGGDAEQVPDPMAGPAAAAHVQRFPTGWIVVTDGPGKGHFFALFNGVSSLGRDEGQVIALAFGDLTISRENHAAIAYDAEDKQFYIGHGGKSNIIRLNGRPVLSTEPLTHGDVLRIGETVLRFVAFCGADFDWAAHKHD